MVNLLSWIEILAMEFLSKIIVTKTQYLQNSTINQEIEKIQDTIFPISKSIIIKI